MDYVKKQRFLIGAIIFLVLINLITLGSFWYGRVQDPDIQDFRKKKFNRFEKELRLSSEQAEKFRELRDEHHKEMTTVVGEVKATKKALFRLMQDPDIDSALREQYLQHLGDLHRKIEKMQFNHFLETREICNAEQKVVFDSMMQRMTSRMYFGPDKRHRKFKRN